MIKELLQKLFGGQKTSPAMTTPERETRQENNDMTNYTIFGRGNMATAIAGVLTNGGATVTHIGSEHSDLAKITGEVVILAVPFAAAEEIAINRAADLAGKAVIDITNPLNFETFDSLVVPAGSSAAAELQAKLPKSRVIKAFNTNFADTLSTGKVGDLTTTVLVAGEDEEAKASLIEDVNAGGLDALDAGSLKRAHELEALGFLQLALAGAEKVGWTGGFGLVK